MNREYVAKIVFSVFAFSLSAHMLRAQPVIQWQKSLGGSGIDVANSIQQTADGGYIIAGSSYSNDGDITGNHGGRDCWVVKLDKAGTIQWQKSFGGSGMDDGNSIEQTTDGGYIVACYTTSNDGDITGYLGGGDGWIIKLDASGSLQWQKSIGGSGLDVPNSIQQTSDGGYIVAGYTNSTGGDLSGNHASVDCWVIKLDHAGTIQWQKSLGGSDFDVGKSIQQTTDGGYILAGHSASNDGDVTGHHGDLYYWDYWVVKLDAAGTIQWQKSLGGSNEDAAASIQQTTDGGYIVAGSSASNDGDLTGKPDNAACWIVKLDAAGTIQWQNSFGGSISNVNCIRQTVDGGYIFAGYSDSTDVSVPGLPGSSDCWAVKLNAAGTLQWQKSLGGSADDEARSIQQTTDGGYIIAGLSYSNDGDVTGNHGSSDYWIIKLAASDTTILPALPHIAYANREFTDANGWTNYYSNDTLLLSLKKNGQNIGTIGDGTFQVKVAATQNAGSNSGILLTNPLITNSSGYWVMNRYWLVTPANEPSSDIGVRFYYNNQDLADVNGSYPTHNLTNRQLIFYKSVGGNPDPTTNLQGTTAIISILPSVSLSGDASWTYHELTDTTQYAEFSVADFSGGGGGGTGNLLALPVTYLNFAGVLQGNEAQLTWSTTIEINNKGFEVEKSMDGQTFFSIGFVDGQGNSSGRNSYSFTDRNVLSASNYYRLKQVEVDGRFTYSAVIKLGYPKFDWKVSGIPVSNNSWVQVQLDKPANVSVEVISINGALIQTIQKGHISAGIYFIPLTLGSASAGTYVVRLIVNDHVYTKKVIR